MLSESARAAIDTLSRLGWTARASDKPTPLPAAIDERYPDIPSSVRSFLEHIEQCVRGGEQVWFLTSADYAGTSGSGFAWNAWEALESEDADTAEAADISAFWNAHLPILLSVQGDYTYLAVCVDKSSANYGFVVQGYSPEFRETSTLCRSFDELLEQIKRLEQGALEDELAALIMHPHDQRWLKSQQESARRQQGAFDRVMERVRSWRLFESYRVAVVVERSLSRPLWEWANWSTIMPPLTAVISGIKAQAVIHPRQAGERDNWLRFGRLPWNEKNNRTWTTKYLTDPNLVGKVSFVATEIWAPSRAISFERRRGPELFCLLDRNEPANTQGFVLAIRKDLLSRVDIAADETIFSVREFFEKSDCVVFDRRWGEFGRFGATITISGLDWTGSTAVLHWAQQHKKHHVRSFRWRRWMG
jgi:hypothetical protein